jgi:5'-methylthioadenosine phosphorylase
MTNMPEAKLAREAEMSYATIALATDYDCWHESEETVSVEAVMKTLASNVEKAKRMIRRYAELAKPDTATAECTTAARSGLMTAAAKIPAETRAALDPIFRAFLG